MRHYHCDFQKSKEIEPATEEDDCGVNRGQDRFEADAEEGKCHAGGFGVIRRLSASLPGFVAERLRRPPGMVTCGAAAAGNSRALQSGGTEGRPMELPQTSTNAPWLHQAG